MVVLVATCTKESRPPSVLIITLDTTRADAIGPDTPAIQAFLRVATRFEGARTTVPLTLPAHVSLFTGLTPAHHAVHDNVTPPLPRERKFSLLAEEYRAKGYATAAFAAYSVVSAATGLDAGFDTYDCPDGLQQAVCEDRVLAAERWLAARDRGRRFFLWVHFFEPHTPYEPWPGDDQRLGTTAGSSSRELYRGEVRRMDAAVGRLLALVPTETIVVIVSDHGEGLGEHDESEHGPLCYGSVIDCFLAVRGPGLQGGTRRGPRSIVDVAPTLRRWCGLPERPHDGTQLDGPPSAAVVSESLYTWRQFGWGQVFAVSDGRFTLVESGAQVELFDRSADPGETRPLNPAGHPAYERLDRALRAYRSAPGREEDRLQLGAGTPYGAERRPLARYLPRAENARLPNPRERFPLWSMLVEARNLVLLARERRHIERASATLEALAREDPANPAPSAALVHAYAKLRQPRKAARAAQEAIERGYRVASMLRELLEQSLRGGNPEDLRAALDVALEKRIVPDLRCCELVVEAARLCGAAELGRKYLRRARRFLDAAPLAVLEERLGG